MSKKLVQGGIVALAIFWAFAAMPQESRIALPVVAGATVPLYPPLARAAKVQGVVHVKITTDGHRVVATHVEDGPRLLAAAAKANAQTWLFSTHAPTTFTVTYHYKLDARLKGNHNNPTVVLRLPSEVEVSISPMPPLDAAGKGAGHPMLGF